MSEEKYDNFKRDLASLLNKYSIDNDCETPDFILAAYITHHLDDIALLVQKRLEWCPGFLRDKLALNQDLSHS